MTDDDIPVRSRPPRRPVEQKAELSPQQAGRLMPEGGFTQGRVHEVNSNTIRKNAKEHPPRPPEDQDAADREIDRALRAGERIRMDRAFPFPGNPSTIHRPRNGHEAVVPLQPGATTEMPPDEPPLLTGQNNGSSIILVRRTVFPLPLGPTNILLIGSLGTISP